MPTAGLQQHLLHTAFALSTLKHQAKLRRDATDAARRAAKLELELITSTFHTAFALTTLKHQAKLRRDATDAARRAAKLELELKRVEKLAAHRAADIASLKAALKGVLSDNIRLKHPFLLCVWQQGPARARTQFSSSQTHAG